MTDLSDSGKLVYKAKHKIRFVTAASLFDGHDASINIMRRILQASGAEVIHLGHNRSVEEIVRAALQEDVQGIAVSSYQGGHIEFFKYMLDLLRSRGGEHIKVFGGGGGVIVPAEIQELQDYGIARIYSPEDGQRMGLQGMINDILARCDFDPTQYAPKELKKGDLRALLAEATETLVAFESPRRVAGSLAVLAELDPDRPVAVCRELTKVHEELARGTLSQLADRFSGEVRGEVVVVVSGAPEQEAVEDPADLEREVRERLSRGERPKDIAEALSKTHAKREVYQLALKLKDR